jgi:hypothetical protein
VTVYRLLDGQAGRPGVGSSGTRPPGSVAGDSGPFLAGMVFQVTASGLWLSGYQWWVPPGGDTGSQKYALQQLTSPDHGIDAIVVPAAAVTSGTLAAGAMNEIGLGTPAGLSAGVPYVAATGWTMTAGFPISQNQLGSGQPYAAGITSGPVQAFSDRSGSAPVPLASDYQQGLFTATSPADPAITLFSPSDGFNSSLFWPGPVITDTPPPGAVYELFPGQPDPIGWEPDTGNNFTLGVQFTLAKACGLNWIRYYSPPGVTQLATECGIWAVSGQTLITATHVTSPAWTGAAGSGYVYQLYTGVTLPAGDYKATVYNGAASPAIWNAETSFYWSTGPGAAGTANGPLAAPSTATAAPPGQCTYNMGTPFAYPLTYSSVAGGPNYWVDIGVTPLAASASAPLLLAGIP